MNTRLRHLFICLPMAAALALPGCNPDDKHPVEPKSAALTAETNLKNISENLGASTAFLAESDAIAEVFASMQDCEEDEDVAPAAAPACLGLPGCEEEPPAPPQPSCGPEAVKADLRELNAEIDAQMDKLLERLREDVFVDANIESQSETEIVYRLPQAVLCEMTDEPDCAGKATTAEPRVRVTSPAEGDLDLAVLMTAKRVQPFVIKLYRNRMGVTVDLAALRETMVAVSPEEAAEVERLSGVVSLALVKNAARDFSLLANVEKPFHMIMRQEDGKKVETHLDASAKTYELRLDGAAKTVTAAMNVGTLSVKTPLENLSGMVDAQPNMAMMSMTDIAEMILGGLNGSITFDGNRDVLAFKGLGLGNRSSGFMMNGQEITGIDVNKNSGRRFDLTVSGSQTESPLLTFEPGLDIEMRLNYQAVADKFEDLPVALLNDTLRFSLSGSKPALRSAKNGTQVVSGTLSLTSAAKPSSNVTVASGMCLVSSGNSSDELLLSAWTSGSCEL